MQCCCVLQSSGSEFTLVYPYLRQVCEPATSTRLGHNGTRFAEHHIHHRGVQLRHADAGVLHVHGDPPLIRGQGRWWRRSYHAAPGSYPTAASGYQRAAAASAASAAAATKPNVDLDFNIYISPIYLSILSQYFYYF